MNFVKIIPLLVVGGLSLSAGAQPQPGQGPQQGQGQMSRPGPGGGGGPGGPPQAGPQRPGFGPQAQGPGRGAGPDHRFQRGDRLPPDYRQRQNYVTDWRAHHLSAPPRGHQWVQVGADYALIAIATGVITSLVLSQ